MKGFQSLILACTMILIVSNHSYTFQIQSDHVLNAQLMVHGSQMDNDKGNKQKADLPVDQISGYLDMNGNPLFQKHDQKDIVQRDSLMPDAIQEYGFTGAVTNGQYGFSVAPAGDVNADGYDDIIVGAPFDGTNFTDAGRAFIYFGGPVVNYTADVVISGQAVGELLGSCVASAGDVNNDGYDDVIIGVAQAFGKAYLYFGGSNMNNTADIVFTGPINFGFSVANVGDVNDDGYSDILIGSYSEGKTYLYFGGITMDNIADLVFSVPNSDFGISVSGAGDVNSDGYKDIIIGARFASSGSFFQNGSALIYFGGTLLDNTPDVTISGSTNVENLGAAVSSAGDVNGDGYSDVIVGAYQFNIATGRAMIYYGGNLMNNVADVTLTGKQIHDNFGQSVAGAGDINGDGFDDVVVGAYQSDAGGVDAGSASVFFGGTTMDIVADNFFTGKSSLDGFGCSIATGFDFNDDGYSDFVVGAYKNDQGGSDAGAAYLYTNTVNSTQISMLTIPGSVPSQRLGWSISHAGDLNGDGFDDIVAGNGDFLSNQPALVFFGSRFMDRIPDVNLYGSEFVSYRVSSAGDVNNDGYDDIITSDPFNPTNGTNAGAAFIFLGGSGMAGIPAVTFYGVSSEDKFGTAISTAGDVNNDGYDDVIVGAPLNDNAGSNAGAAYIFFGGSNMNNVPDVILYGEATNDQFGFAVSNGRKLNLDIYDDVIVGAPYGPTNNQSPGRVYVFNGGNSMDNIADLIINGINYLYPNSAFGYSVESAGDVNGDSYNDILIGALEAEYSTGKAYLYYGGNILDNIADVTLRGELGSYQFGGSLAAPGDINQDGYSDVIIGESNNSSFQSQAGRVSIFYGGAAMNNVADRIIYGESQLNLFGYSLSGAGDLDGDGLNEFVVGAPSNNNGGQLAGKVYIFKPSETGTDIEDQYLVGYPGDQSGYSVSSTGDINDDGYDDVIIGFPYNDYAGIDAGLTFIYYGGEVLDFYPDVFMSGAYDGDHFGTSVSLAGDVNQDGYPDVIVGATENDAGGIDAGRAYIYFGGPGMNNVADVILTGEAPGDRFGFSVSRAGNVNGDAAGDVIVGAVFNDAGGSNAGRAYVFYGGTSMNNIPDVVITGAGAGYWLGISCSYAGNVNADFYDDVIVGASMHDVPGPGQAYVFLGSSSMDNIPDVTMNGNWEGDQFGYSVSTAGNINADLYSDVIVGAYGASVNGMEDAGRAYIYYGTAVMNNVEDFILTGAAPFDYFGVSVSSAGNMNSDQYEDVIVGACYNDAGGPDAGRAYVYYGGAPMNVISDLTMTGKNSYDNFGWSVAYAGDLNTDGKSDLIIGANMNDAGGVNAGKSYIYLNSDPVNQLILTLKLIPEGLYNSNLNDLNMSDTVIISLHDQNFPYNQIDITKGVISKVTFEGRFFFTTAPSGSYYVRVRHRNCIDTWSYSPLTLVKNTNLNYDFTDEAFRAFGFNQKIVSNVPLLFGIYSGDVNRDGTVDATDVSIVDNDALNFVSGYVVTDLTGDYYVDGLDFLVADNNASLFVAVIQP